MSISKFQDVMQNRGCQTALMVLIVGAFVAGSFSTCNRADALGGYGAEPDAAVVARVGNVPVTASQVTAAVTEATQGDPSSLTPAQEANLTLRALTQAYNTAAIMHLAEKNGVRFDAGQLPKLAEEQFNEQLKEVRDRLVQEGALKANATEKELSDAIQKRFGRTLEDVRKNLQEQVGRANTDPAVRAGLLGGIAFRKLQEQLKAKYNPAEEELGASFDAYTVKRILLTQKAGKEPPAARAEKALAELKGGAAFEAVIAKYSDETAAPGKKLADNTLTIQGEFMKSLDEYKPVIGLKAGQTTGAVPGPQGTSIYKVVEVKRDLPKDFAKEKAKYRTQYVDQKVQEELTKMLEALPKDANVTKWEAPGYRVLFEFGQFVNDPKLAADEAARTAALRKIVDDARKAMNENKGYDSKAASLALYVAFDTLYNSPSTDRTKLREERIDVLSTYLQNSESFEVRDELVGLFLEAKQGDQAGRNLLSMAQLVQRTDLQGEDQFRKVGQRLAQLQAAKLLPEQLDKQVQGELTRWRKDKLEADKAEAAAKAAAEAERLKAEAEAKKSGKAGAAAPGGLLDTQKGGTAGGMMSPQGTSAGTGTGTAGATTGGGAGSAGTTGP